MSAGYGKRSTYTVTHEAQTLGRRGRLQVDISLSEHAKGEADGSVNLIRCQELLINRLKKGGVEKSIWKSM
jgi:hypothetical protein